MKKLAVVLFAVLLLISCAGSSLETKMRSKHFKNGVFKNVNPVRMFSFWEMVKFGFSNDVERSEWPQWIEKSEDNRPVSSVMGGDIRVTFVNHATFLIQLGGYNILTDPVFSERTSPVSFVGPKRIHRPGIAIDNLPKIDAIIISHDHYDHLDLPSIELLVQRDAPKIFVGLGVAERLNDEADVLEMDWWQKHEFASDFDIWFLDVQHFSGRTLTDRNTTLWGGFMLELAGKKIYFGGDSGYADHYTRTFEKFGPVDLAFIPIGAYSPREAFKAIHLDPFEAVQAHKDLQSKKSIGMHYGTFQLSAEALAEPVELLYKALKEANLNEDAFIVLNVGEPTVLTAPQD